MLDHFNTYCERTNEACIVQADILNNDVLVKFLKIDSNKQRIAYTHYKTAIIKEEYEIKKIFYVEFKNTGRIIFYKRKAVKQEIEELQK